MSSYEIRFTKTAAKDVDKLTPKLKTKLREICVNTIGQNPYSGKKLVGDLDGFYSFRLTFKDRIVYTVDEKNKVVFIHRAKTHYGD
ncbi:MAG TPA: type II toxin-antitoxin system mRNA interferase toxin, RelE/StbE family [Lentisphaeria bacterium]|nr:MAG: toxin of toxin-antitoxin system [Lentisphaerae bacterium GWF2_50_93]HCE45512.1 type II toxin-antitoxin system mRNA interferase toxin, RelE/StbE family [Lentisphaeria bacterium]